MANPRNPDRNINVKTKMLTVEKAGIGMESAEVLLSNLKITEEPQTIQLEPHEQLPDGSFKCNKCKKSYKLLGPLKKHLEANHQLKDVISYKCETCMAVFNTQKQLTRHRNAKTVCSKK